MNELTSEQRETVRRKEVANILAARNAGKRITREQRALLDEATAEEPGKYAANWHELALRLKRSRRCLTKWREKYKGQTPKPRADGRHLVGAWLRFMDENGLADEPEPEDDGLPTKAHWDRERARVDYERAVFNLEVEREKHISIEAITGGIGQMLSGFRTALNMLPGSAARWLIGLKDFHAIKNKLQSEVDAVLQALGRHRYLEELAPSVIDKLFGERDASYRADLLRSFDEAVRELGRQALSDLVQREMKAAAPDFSPAPPAQPAIATVPARVAPAIKAKSPATESTPQPSNQSRQRKRGRKHEKPPRTAATTEEAE